VDDANEALMQLVSSGRRVELFRGFEQKKDSAIGLKLAENLASACLEGGGGGVAWLAEPGQILTEFQDSGSATVITLCKERKMPDDAVQRARYFPGNMSEGQSSIGNAKLFSRINQKERRKTDLTQRRQNFKCLYLSQQSPSCASWPRAPR